MLQTATVAVHKHTSSLVQSGCEPACKLQPPRPCFVLRQGQAAPWCLMAIYWPHVNMAKPMGELEAGGAGKAAGEGVEGVVREAMV